MPWHARAPRAAVLQHEHVHSHRRAHPHAQGFDLYPSHGHVHVHRGWAAAVGPSVPHEGYAPPHRPHRHTAEQAATIEADYRLLVR